MEPFECFLRLAAEVCRDDELLDSEQVRLKRLYPAASYRATTSVVTLPIPRTGGVGSARLRDDEVIEYLATFLRNLKPLEQADR